jgi:hypothetical protein
MKLALLAGVAVIAVGAGFLAVGDRTALPDENAKRSYALGRAFGKQLRAQAVEIDVALYERGLRDALSGDEVLLTEAEVRAAIHRLQLDLKNRKRVAQRDAKPSSPAAAERLDVSFQVDPRVTKGLYMGERWVSSATYSSASAADGEAIEIAARVRGQAAARPAALEWSASDPQMVTVTPARGPDVTISVRSAGESTVTVTDGERSSAFAVKTFRVGERWRADLSLVSQPTPATAVTTASDGTAPDPSPR